MNVRSYIYDLDYSYGARMHTQTRTHTDTNFEHTYARMCIKYEKTRV